MAENTEKELTALLQVRRDKLKELQDAGADPFKITKYKRTHTSGEILNGCTEEQSAAKRWR